MKAAPLLVHWHNETPVYSADFEPHGKGRLATAGGDNNVRLWKIDSSDEERKVTYLSTLTKHTCAVNVVRWCPKGEMLASAGDDGNVLLWVPAENQKHRAFGDDGLEDKETWRVKRMCGPMGTDIYDLAWSPDGTHFITGSMDNIARIYNASTGTLVRQIAEHANYIQGVAWDPLNEYIATQSSDKSVHIWSLKDKEGRPSLQDASLHNKFTRMDQQLHPRRISSSSPAPPEFNGRASFVSDQGPAHSVGSPIPSVPGTPQSLALPMNPPPTSRSRRSSFGTSPSVRRSASPAPSLPLPAVMPSHSPSLAAGLGLRTLAYADADKFTSFFRRLTFAPDGSLLFTPSGQIKVKPGEFINTVYIHSRGGFNKDPIAHLPGHKKPSIAVKCSPVVYQHRPSTGTTKYITIDTSTADEEIPALPEPAVATRQTQGAHSMDPPPLNAPSPAASITAASPKTVDSDSGPNNLPPGPTPIIGLPYRIIYAVATQDAVHIHDTQQTKPLIIVSNLHYATFTDLTWSIDGQTLLITSSDGFCSYLSFAAGELGQRYTGPVPTFQHPHPISTATSSQNTTPAPTPTVTQLPPMLKQPSASGNVPASPSSSTFARPANVPGSPARSMSASSIASFAPPSAEQSVRDPATGDVLLHATPTMGAIPNIAASNSAPVPGNMPLWTPPETPGAMPLGGAVSGHYSHRTHSASSSMSGIGSFVTRRDSEPERPIFEDSETRKRDQEAEPEDAKAPKRRRIAPQQVLEDLPEKPSE